MNYHFFKKLAVCDFILVFYVLGPFMFTPNICRDEFT